MSETIEQPQGEPAPEPQPAPAPDTEAPGTEQLEQTPEQKEAARGGDRRFAALTAKLSAAEREQARQAAELAFYRQQVAQQAPQDETPEQRHHRERAAIRAEVETQIRTETFHQQGASQFNDWKQRCDDLVSMGADAGFAQLLVEMPDGVKVAAALAADPAEVQRIAGIGSERGRAIALGKYAASIDDAPRGNGSGAARDVPVTRAPAPVRPVTGRVTPTFNEYTADPQTLVDRYMKQAVENRLRR